MNVSLGMGVDPFDQVGAVVVAVFVSGEICSMAQEVVKEKDYFDCVLDG